MNGRFEDARPPTFRPLHALAAWVVPLIVAAVGVATLQAVNQLHKLQLDGRIVDDPLRVGTTDLRLTYHRQVVLNRWGVVSLIAAGIVFLVWLYRAASNARAAGRFPDSPGMAVGSWFIPIANLVLPVVVIVRLMRESRPERHRLLLAAWWLAWLLASASGLLGASIGRAGRPLTDIHRADAFWVVAHAARIVAGVLLVVIVRLMTTGQESWPVSAHDRNSQERLFEYRAGAPSGSS